ncbi:MAG TPA: hypothetical protein VGF32_07815 [Streptosporangiaceae bacterium]
MWRSSLGPLIEAGLVAAVGERERVTVLHYGGGYDLIAHITGQPMQWVVPRGTVP